MPTKYLPAPAATLSEGLPVDYLIEVDGKKIKTSGTVASVRRVGPLAIEVTLHHRKTGETHVNVLHAQQDVFLYASFLQDGYIDQMIAGDPQMPGLDMVVDRELAEMWVHSNTEQLLTKMRNNVNAFFKRAIED